VTDLILNAVDIFKPFGYVPGAASGIASISSIFSNPFASGLKAPSSIAEAVKRATEAKEAKQAQEAQEAKQDQKPTERAVARAEGAQEEKKDPPEAQKPAEGALARAKEAQEEKKDPPEAQKPAEGALARAKDDSKEQKEKKDSPEGEQPKEEATNAYQSKAVPILRTIANVADIGVNIASIADKSQFLPVAPAAGLSSLFTGEGLFNAFSDNKKAPQSIEEAIKIAREEQAKKPKKEPEATKSEALLTKIAASMEAVTKALAPFQEGGLSLDNEKVNSIVSAELLRPLAEELGRLVCESALHEYQRRGWY
jgi:hypothetical protein